MSILYIYKYSKYFNKYFTLVLAYISILLFFENMLNIYIIMYHKGKHLLDILVVFNFYH